MHADIITILSSVPNAKYLTISIPKRGLDLEHLRLGTGCLCPNLEGLTVRPAPQPSFKQFRRLVGSRLPTSQCLRLGGSLVTARKDERHPAWLKKHVNFQLMADGGMKFEQALDYMQRRA
ncbi:hypothetical protein FRB98_006506 [Tulasnella sp. 332]|nr:hypothetical protein FRB98_006506 [Tulasnella sp. 332]